jgi:hypothetical protein
MSPSRCHGSAAHASGCRPGRPLCRWMRTRQAARKPCFCSFVHYPHRAGYCTKHDAAGVPLAILRSPSFVREAACAL